MLSLGRNAGYRPGAVVALAMGTASFFGISAPVRSGEPSDMRHSWHCRGSACGARASGALRTDQGFAGFGLSYHLGYGYGGSGLGVGPDGGYPFYGGPGYPHDGPPLRRFGRIAPFLYLGGPGYLCAGRPNAFAAVGPLVENPSVVTTGADRHSGDYGAFTGALPYPPAFFAPYTDAAAATRSSRAAREREDGTAQSTRVR